MEDFNQTIAEHLKSQDDLEFGLGDTLDIKTSIALVIIIFLATQSAGFLASSMPLHWHNVQIISVVCVIISGILAVWELIPRTYIAGMGPSEFIGWVEQLRTFYSKQGDSNPETKIVETIRNKEIEKIKARFATNRAINATKSKAVEWSFYFMMTALAVNLVTLLALSSGWRF